MSPARGIGIVSLWSVRSGVMQQTHNVTVGQRFQQRSPERGMEGRWLYLWWPSWEKAKWDFEAKPKVCVSHQNDAYKVLNIWQEIVFNHTTLGDFYYFEPVLSFLNCNMEMV